MVHLSDPLHIWLAALLIVMPVPEAWVKVGIAVLMVVLIAVAGG